MQLPGSSHESRRDDNELDQRVDVEWVVGGCRCFGLHKAGLSSCVELHEML